MTPYERLFKAARAIDAYVGGTWPANMRKADKPVSDALLDELSDAIYECEQEARAAKATPEAKP